MRKLHYFRKKEQKQVKKIITYSLIEGAENSESFYKDLTSFTDTMLQDAGILLENYVEDFCNFMKTTAPEKFRSNEEYLFELVMLGVFWRNYIISSEETNYLSKIFLKNLYWIRKNNKTLKPAIDKVRGVLAYKLLSTGKSRTEVDYGLPSFQNLVSWLSATGEFNEEVIRMRHWITYFKNKRNYETEAVISSACSFADRFYRCGKEVLGKYTCEVEHFRQSSLKDYAYREDFFFIGRKENEYYLNMFGAEIMNRQLREEFRKTQGKAVLLPTCMRTEPRHGCKAVSDGKELVCVKCNTSECNIGKIAKMVEDKGITPYLIPHSSDFSRFLVKWKNDSRTGLIGVACVLNLLTGGYEMKRLNIPSQCVFLDYCGCKKHWDKKGFPTHLNTKKLIEIAG